MIAGVHSKDGTMTREICGLMAWCALFLVLGIGQIFQGIETIRTQERWIRKALGRQLLRLKTRKVVGRPARILGIIEVICGAIITFGGSLITIVLFILDDSVRYRAQMTQFSCLLIVVVLMIAHLLRTILFYTKGHALDADS
jgi:hypothetical protein